MDSNTEADKLLTPKQVAALLQLHPVTVRRFINEGRLPAVRLGGKWLRIRQSDVRSFVDAQPRV